MRIANLVYEYPPNIAGGLGTYAAEITRELVRMNHNVSVFTMNNDEGNLSPRDLYRGVEIRRIKTADMADSLPVFMADDIKKWGRGLELFSKVLVYNCITATEIIQDYESSGFSKYDLVVAHDWLSAMAGITIRREKNIPFVFHLHSTEKGRTLGNGSQIISGIEQQAGHFADRVITVSYAMREELTKMGIPSEKIRVCYNGVNSEKYSVERITSKEIEETRQKYGIGDEEFMILFIGRLTWIKGASNLVMAMTHVLNQIPNTKLIIIGIGETKKYLEKLVEDFKLNDKVKFRFEFIPENERIKHYAACDLAVFPSLYEPFGIVALEAMSMMKPVIVGTTGVSGLKEIIIPEGPNQCGFHMNPRNPNEIASAIIDILQNPDLRIRLGQNGRRRILESFDWRFAAKKTLEIYSELLESNDTSLDANI